MIKSYGLIKIGNWHMKELSRIFLVKGEKNVRSNNSLPMPHLLEKIAIYFF